MAATRVLGGIEHRVSSGSFSTGTVEVNRKVTTTDATATVIYSIPVAVGEAVQVSGFLLGRKSDATAAIGCNFSGEARRQSAGNVTVVGTPLATIRESTANTDVTWVANTTDQTLELKVTGIAAETWVWEAHILATKI